jgi:hypothetical protein
MVCAEASSSKLLLLYLHSRSGRPEDKAELGSCEAQAWI